MRIAQLDKMLSRGAKQAGRGRARDDGRSVAEMLAAIQQAVAAADAAPEPASPVVEMLIDKPQSLDAGEAQLDRLILKGETGADGKRVYSDEQLAEIVRALDAEEWANERHEENLARHNRRALRRKRGDKRWNGAIWERDADGE